MKDINKLLIDLKFNIESDGVIYWLEAIKLAKKYPLNLRICELYKKLAKKFKTTEICIERSMRFAIAPAKEAIKKRYNYDDKISNITFLNLIRLEFYK